MKKKATKKPLPKKKDEARFVIPVTFSILADTQEDAEKIVSQACAGLKLDYGRYMTVYL